ncbi:MAG: antibiotic biosynthesis monooxygenase [Melioribacteraceae bacterium]|jgi:quinol monooxygenase YgiN|nr:antibiotic biosynthesis monooxygenase [Melioribacteraceae bacterium]
MYARVTTLHLKIDKRDEAIDIFQNSILPEAKKQQGFMGASFFVNKNAGKFVSITVWKDMEAAVANQKTGYYKRQIDKFENLQVVVPEFEGFDVPVLSYGNDSD